MNISHLLAALDEYDLRNLECGLADAESALQQVVQAIGNEMPDRPSQRDRDELRVEINRILAMLGRLNEAVSSHAGDKALQEAYDIIAADDDADSDDASEMTINQMLKDHWAKYSDIDIDPTDPEQLATELMRGWS